METVSCHGCRERDARIAELEARILELQNDPRVAELEAKILELQSDPRVTKLEEKILDLEKKSSPPCDGQAETAATAASRVRSSSWARQETDRTQTGRSTGPPSAFEATRAPRTRQESYSVPSREMRALRSETFRGTGRQRPAAHSASGCRIAKGYRRDHGIPGAFANVLVLWQSDASCNPR